MSILAGDGTALLRETSVADNWGPGHMDGDWGWGGWLGMVLMMVLFWTLVAAVIVAAIRTSRGGHPRAESTPLDVAAMRYARGEIGEEEFQRIKQGLQR